jgi:hypothetical protein
MNKKDAMIKGYEIAKTTELNGEMKLAIEVSKIDESTIKCESCIHGSNVCNAASDGTPINAEYKNSGMSVIVVNCSHFKER